MALPSQSGARSGGRVSVSRRRKSVVPRQALVVGGGALLVILAVWGVASVLSGGEPSSALASPPAPEREQGSDVLAMDSLRPRDERAETPIEQPRVQEPAPKTEPLPVQPEAPVVKEPVKDGGPIPPPVPRGPESRQVGDSLELARMREAEGKLVEARDILNRALHAARSDADRAMLRERLERLNEDLVYSPKVHPGDPMVMSYEVQSGDSLARIVKKQGLMVDYRLLVHINRLASANRINLGQKIKLVKGPFHAVVDKSDYRLDLYWGPSDKPKEWVFVRSFPVGLGEDDGTPVGDFHVKENSRLENPVWRNPRTGEFFGADDPNNPIGEHWIGIEGEGESAVHLGYGIHGTIDPGSIGQSRSMGCVRMRSEDVALVYGHLADVSCKVKITP